MCNKRHVSKMNIISIITCFSLIFIFVFGCVQYAFASGISEDNVKSELTKRYGLDFSNIYYMTTYYPNGNIRITALNYDINKYDVYAAFSIGDGGSSTYGACYKEKGNNVWYGANTFACTMNSKGDTWFKGNGDSSLIAEVIVNSDCTATSNFPVYDMSGKTGNLSYTNIEKNEFPLVKNLSITEGPVEYDSSVEIPLMAQCQVNGDKFLFNCKQSSPHDDYKIQVSTSVSLTPIYSNLTSKQYADTQQIYTSAKSKIGEYNNFNTVFNVSFSSTDLLNGIDTSRKSLGFKEFYSGYNILLPYKEATLSKIYFYARNVSGVKCSNWVKVTYDLITETSSYEEVESVAGSDVPSDIKKDSSEYYPDDYIYNDNEPAQDSSSSGIIGYIKSGLGLVGNNSIIALIGNTFSFLPKELTTLLLFGGALLVAVGIVKVVTR